MYKHATLCLLMLAMVLTSGVDSTETKEAAERIYATKAPAILQSLTSADLKSKLAAAQQDPASAPKLLKQLPKAAPSIRIQWPACKDYKKTVGVYPRVAPILVDWTGLTSTQCLQLCTSNSECGGVVFYAPFCILYNINDDIVNNHLIPAFLSNIDLSNLIWYSKTCAYKGCPSCDEYDNRVYHNQVISNQVHWITYSFTIPGLTANVCQDWCTVHPGCKSATFTLIGSGSGACHLYSTTIQQLMDAGGAGVAIDVLATTYDRYCCKSCCKPYHNYYLT